MPDKKGNPTTKDLFHEIRTGQQEIHIEVKQLSTTLLGIPGTGDKGLVGEVINNRKDINKLKRNLFILIGTLVGSGVLGTGIWGLLNG